MPRARSAYFAALNFSLMKIAKVEKNLMKLKMCNGAQRMFVALVMQRILWRRDIIHAELRPIFTPRLENFLSVGHRHRHTFVFKLKHCS